MRPTMRCHGTNREAHHSALLSVDRRYHWLIANRSIQARSRRDKKKRIRRDSLSLRRNSGRDRGRWHEVGSQITAMHVLIVAV